MTDTLRTRIAAVIESIRIQRDGDAARMADAVIHELGMRQEWLVYNANGGGRICDSERLARVLLNQPVRPPGIEDPGGMPYVAVEVRYVTEWTADD